MDDYRDLLRAEFLDAVRSSGKSGLTLSVYGFFEKESFSGKCLSEAVRLLSETGISVRFFSGGRDELKKSLCGENLLAFVDCPEKTGRLAMAADALCLPGVVVYGNKISGVSMERENIVTRFRRGSFHSDYVKTSRFAFPEIRDEELQSLSAKESMIPVQLVVIYLGLMLYALGREGGLLPSMDAARALYNRFSE